WEQQLTQAGAKITPIGENVVRIEGMQHIRQHPLITSRVILVTDLGAQSAVNLAPLGARMLEVGCGRGTKTLIWADRARREGMEAKLIGVDKSAHKIEHAQEDADRLGFDEIGYQVADATDETLLAEETFDVVFVDAPCSGLGTLRRRSDKRLRLKPEDIDELADLSATILRTSAQKVREGGTLLYATCTMSRRENDEVVAGFLASVEGADFQLDPIDESELPDAVSTIRSEHGFVQMQPISGGGDGHFVARLARS
ncbi:MAG: methyltransferase domain-containing protein, partial [Actinomycetia bacterium]|nr:methyltransferase domain-containing protein [Actinomycetes bacterium]